VNGAFLLFGREVKREAGDARNLHCAPVRRSPRCCMP